jgi:hypothetical protein
LNTWLVGVIEQLDKENRKRLIKHNPVQSFEEAVRMFGCDVCERHTHENNPIYTSTENQGMDICTICIENVWKELNPIEGIRPGPVYSLEKINQLSKACEKNVLSNKSKDRDYVKGGMILNCVEGVDNRNKKRKEIDMENEIKQLKEENKRLKTENKGLLKKQKSIKKILN